MRIEPERSITRAMSRGRWTAWAVAVDVREELVPKIVLNAPGKLFEVTVAATAVYGHRWWPGNWR